jgi:hypothetical protein
MTGTVVRSIVGHEWTGSRFAWKAWTRRYAIVEAPSVLGLPPTGVERLPEALLGVGDVASLSSQFFSIVPGASVPILLGGGVRANIRVQERGRKSHCRSIRRRADRTRRGGKRLAAQNREVERLASLRLSVDANRRALDLATTRSTSRNFCRCSTGSGPLTPLKRMSRRARPPPPST